MSGTFSTKKSASPYDILQLSSKATKTEIKASFRRLAKEYHPDINKNIPQKESELLMMELIDAYNTLIDDDNIYERIGDYRIALDCELYTIQELRLNRNYQVYSIQIRFPQQTSLTSEQKQPQEDPLTKKDLTSEILFPISAHEDDSVSDLKRTIQSQYGSLWGLDHRRFDRDGVATGWELVFYNTTKIHDKNNSHHHHHHDKEEEEESMSVLSYHLFLSSYGISHGDIVHAVVRQQGNE